MREISSYCVNNFINIYKKYLGRELTFRVKDNSLIFLLEDDIYFGIKEETLYKACCILEGLTEEFLCLYADSLSPRCWGALFKRNTDKPFLSEEFCIKYKLNSPKDFTDVKISVECANDIDAIFIDYFHEKAYFNNESNINGFVILPAEISKRITDDVIRESSYLVYYSEDFLRHFAPIFSKLTWDKVSEDQCLSKSFLKDFADKINWDLLIKFSTYKDNLINYFELRDQFLKENKELKAMATTKGTTTMATTKGTTTMATTNVTAMIKSDSLKASYRVASRQMVKGVTKALLATLNSKYTPEQLKFLEGLLKTDLGYALVSGMIGMGLTYAPVEQIQNNPHLQVLAEEFRVSALDTVGTKVLDTITDNFLPVIMECVKLLPQEGEPTVTEVAVVEEKATKSKKA